jgi:hypothetical protein
VTSEYALLDNERLAECTRGQCDRIQCGTAGGGVLETGKSCQVHGRWHSDVSEQDSMVERTLSRLANGGQGTDGLPDSRRRRTIVGRRTVRCRRRSRPQFREDTSVVDRRAVIIVLLLLLLMAIIDAAATANSSMPSVRRARSAKLTTVVDVSEVRLNELAAATQVRR